MTGAKFTARPGERLLLEGLRRYFHVGRRATSRPDTASLREAIACGWRTKTLAQFAEGLAPALDEGGKALLHEEASAFKHRAIAQNAAILAQATGITACLEARSIDVLVFKGALQQHQLFGDYFIRPTSDLDLLVRRRDYRRAIAALAEISYVPTHPASWWWDHFLGERHLFHAGGQSWTIDLHHRLQQPGVPQPRDISAFFERAEMVSFRGRPVPAVSTADIPLVSAMNLLKGVFRRDCTATHACDLMQALGGGHERDRVDAFLASSEAQGLSGTALVSLRILNALFDGHFARLGPRLSNVLCDVEDQVLTAMVLAPESVERWPRRRRIVEAACLGHTASIMKESIWYGGSEAARFAQEGRLRMQGAGPAEQRDIQA